MIDACLTIDGRPVGTDETFAVLNPATGAEAGRAPRAGQAELDAAVAAAKRAFPAWSAQDDATLRAACEAVTAKLQEHAEELARVLTLEQGKPLNGLGSRWEMGGAAAWAGYTASLSLPVQVLQDTNEGRVELHRKPLGVVGSITPWNFPVMIAIWHVLPALRTGNTVVLKPSPYTPLATLRMVEILNEVLPAGVLNAVSGDDAGFNIGAAMSSHPDIAKIVFTGSIGTGRHVMRSAAETLKRLTLELGGSVARQDAGARAQGVTAGSGFVGGARGVANIGAGFASAGRFGVYAKLWVGQRFLARSHDTIEGAYFVGSAGPGAGLRVAAPRQWTLLLGGALDGVLGVQRVNASRLVA